MEVDLGELADHPVEHVGLAQSVDLDAELKLVHHILGGLGEAADVELQRDKTLAPGYMQEPIFERFGVPAAEFWAEVKSLEAVHGAGAERRLAADTIYLNLMLSYVRDGKFRELDNDLLRSLGAEIKLFPGVPQVFPRLTNYAKNLPGSQRWGISVEHYVVSTGLAEMIRGSKVAHHVDGIWGCEFSEHDSGSSQGTTGGPIREVIYALDNTSKTRALFEINKGANVDSSIDVNARMDDHHRRVPMSNMIYIADGPSDVPAFSVVRQGGGRAYAVYDASNEKSFRQAKGLLDDGRVNAFGPADFRPKSHTERWLRVTVEEIATRIATDQRLTLAEAIGVVPTHIVEQAVPEPIAAIATDS